MTVWCVSGKESYHEICQVLLKTLQSKSLSVKSLLKEITVTFILFFFPLNTYTASYILF